MRFILAAARARVINRTLQQRRLIGLLAAGLVACAASAARADACDSLAETFSTNEILDIHREVRELMPARHAALIDTIRIVNGRSAPDVEAGLMPETLVPTDGSPPTIELPHGFRRLQCQMVHWTGHVMELEAPGIEDALHTFLDQQAQCLKQGHPEPVCFGRVMGVQAELPALRAAVHDDADRYKRWTEAALFYVIAHEVAHIILDHDPKNTALLFSSDDELRADYIAQTTLILARLDHRAPLFMMLPLETLAVDRAVRPNRQHPVARCRAAISIRVAERIAPEVAVAHRWALGDREAPPPQDGKQRSLRTEAERFRQALRATADHSREIADCPNTNFDGVEGLHADYDALLGAMDRAVTLSEPSLTATLIRHQPGTPEVRAVLGTLLGLRLARMELDARERKDTRTRVALTPLFAEVRTRFDTETFSTLAKGILTLNGAYNAFELAPAGSNLNAVAEQAAADFRTVETLLPQIAVGEEIAYFDMLRGACKEVTERLVRAKRAAGEPLDQPPDLATCRRLSEELRADVRRERGWR